MCVLLVSSLDSRSLKKKIINDARKYSGVPIYRLDTHTERFVLEKKKRTVHPGR